MLKLESAKKEELNALHEKEAYFKLLLWEILHLKTLNENNSLLYKEIGGEYNSKGLKIQHINGINSWHTQSYHFHPQNEMEITQLDNLVSILLHQYFLVYLINKGVDISRLKDIVMSDAK